MTQIPATRAAGYFGSDLEAMNAAQHYHAWIAAEFQPFLGARVAEVGAGIGNFSEHLLAAGVRDLHSFEPDPRMFELLTQRFHREPRVRTSPHFFGADTDERYDSVVYVNVLEHIGDDRAELATARRCLQPDGHLLIFVPALPWLYSRFDRLVGHYRRYLLGDLQRLLGAGGFHVTRAHYFDSVGILPWLLVLKLFGRTLQPGNVDSYDRFVVPVLRRLESRVRPPIGKNILVVARPAGD